MKAIIAVKCPHCNKTTDAKIWISIFQKEAQTAPNNTCSRCNKEYQTVALLDVSVSK